LILREKNFEKKFQPTLCILEIQVLTNIFFRIFAEADINNSVTGATESSLGILPHQIRGSLSQFSQMSLVGYSSSSCTACCHTVSLKIL